MSEQQFADIASINIDGNIDGKIESNTENIEINNDLSSKRHSSRRKTSLKAKTKTVSDSKKTTKLEETSETLEDIKLTETKLEETKQEAVLTTEISKDSNLETEILARLDKSKTAKTSKTGKIRRGQRGKGQTRERGGAKNTEQNLDNHNLNLDSHNLDNFQTLSIKELVDTVQAEEVTKEIAKSDEKIVAKSTETKAKKKTTKASKKAKAEILTESEEEQIEIQTDASKAKTSSVNRRMFISVVPGEQVEVVITEDGIVFEYYLDLLHKSKLKGNIYKAIISNIDPSLQAAFVNCGLEKNGFLQIDEVHPEYWLVPHEASKGKKLPLIQKALKSGQEILVQVQKDPIGNKGAFLTTWISLAGRFLVLTPGQEQIGISRKVEDEEERGRLRELVSGIEPGDGLGVIVRTVSAGTSRTTLKNDLQYLKRVWRDIRKKATQEATPALIYQEPGLPQRAVRDYFTDSVSEIWVDNAQVADNIRSTISQLFPRKKDLVKLHNNPNQSLWERFGISIQLDEIYSREVWLPSGGRLVFDQTEALMAIDVNSGKTAGKANFESLALKTNLEAAETIARHLRLRDIGGQVVIDFIEMRDRKHVQEVEKTLRLAMKNDRAKHDIGRMSQFSLLELVRQRTGTSAIAVTMETCPQCRGTGQRYSLEWQALQAIKSIRNLLHSKNQAKICYETNAELASYLLNYKRDALHDLEVEYKKTVEIKFTF